MKKLTLFSAPALVAAFEIFSLAAPAYAGDTVAVQTPTQPVSHQMTGTPYAQQYNPVPSSQGQGANYISGGIGDEGMQQILAEQNSYDLKLLLVAQGGAYLSDVNLVIKDGQGNSVLTAMADGPAFLARLPAGHYTVTATAARGSVVTQKVTVGKSLSSTVLRFPANESE